MTTKEGFIEYGDGSYGSEVWTYRGEVVDGRSHGRGVDICRSMVAAVNGHRYEGEHLCPDT
jgi:hypothetical protein